ncbi:nucleotide-binding protein [uncultured Sunxiuqinia sp.]|uniref:nucleotide-binding protein n=1 Tax=uncultured Sunxiuqinia sp. TaxID=1573825 RepID=UPI002611292B|nr:nucleotide-binding protein [uncultured Sunxiuqinia sp.]
MTKEEIINELSGLINIAEEIKLQYGRHDKLFSKWQNDVISFVDNILKKPEAKITAFKGVNYNFYGFVYDGAYKNAFCDGIDKAIGIIQSWQTEVEKFWDNDIHNRNEAQREYTYSCFIVHGHNNEIKLEVKDFIEDLEYEIDCTILHKKANQGKTIVEKFESHAEVDFAVCLWTNDDVGNAKVNYKLNPRARQNVILETGYFWGKYGRERTIILYEDGVEIPNDFSGLVYISYKDNWKDELRKEIEHIYKSPK